MITGSDVYWITRLDDIRNVSIDIIIGTGIPLIILCVLFFLDCTVNEEENDFFDKISFSFLIKLVPVVCVFCCLILAFVPTSKEMAAIKVIPVIGRNEELAKINSDIVKLAKGWLEELKTRKAEKNK